MLIGDILRANARRFPTKLGVIDREARLTWCEVNDRACRLANLLIGWGMYKGDRVAILAENSHRYIETYFALAKAGIIAVPLNYRLTAYELAYLINHSGSRALLVEESYLPVISQIKGEIPGVSRFLVMDKAVPGMDCYEEVLKKSSAEEPTAEVNEHDTFAILYTSGTTGLPKGAMLTHRNFLNNCTNQALADQSRPHDIAFPPTPWYHAGALFFGLTYMYLGCTQVVQRKFDPEEFLGLVKRENVTTTLLIPTMLNMVMHHVDFDQYRLRGLRLIFYGGGPMPVPLLKQAIERIGCSFTQGYGLTETLEATFLVSEDHVLDGSPDRERRLASGGREAATAEVRIVDDNDRPLFPGERGEIVVRSASVMKGYWMNPQATAETLRGGWCHTGDIGYVDEGGYLFIVDRKKDMIISGGENIYPREIEDVLYTHPAVLEAAVIGIPDDKWGEVVMAAVALRPGAIATEEDILQYCATRLAGYKKPRQVKFVTSLPKNPSGKVLKRELRQPYWRGKERQVV
jgi:long-chain acyl-CoA synthetase